MGERAGASEIRIGLLWHSASSGNLGVGALTLANVAIARQVAEELGLTPRFVILGMRDGDTAPILDPATPVFRIDSRAMLSPGGFWRRVGQLDVVLDIGAGDSFADIYGPKRFGFLWLSKMMTVARGVPLILSPQTIGPFTRAPYRRLAALAMRRAAAVVARDRASLALVGSMAPGSQAVLAADVAFGLPFEDRGAERGRARLRVGVNVSGLLLAEAEAGRNRFGLQMDYADFTRKLLSTLAARPEIELHLLTHATHAVDGADDDGRAADRLAQEHPQAIRVPNFAGPSEAKTYISGLDFLVSARMHACIGAFSSGTPVVPIAYSRKFDGVFGMLDYRWTVPVRGMDADGALAHVLRALDERHTLAEEARRGMAKVSGLLDSYRDVLRRTFVAVCAG